MPTDTKKVASAVAVLAREISICRAAVSRMKVMRAKFVAQAPDVTGTPLDGQKANVSARIDALDAEVGSAFWGAAIAADVPTHRGEAL